MGTLEIFVLIAGGIIFVLSFILPRSTEERLNGTKELAREEIKALVSQEMDSVKSHVDEVVDEAVGYAVEKTERSLERLTNEKIMAVNEYSDTVLQEIHKNHEEVMFLYDMLNSKHVNLQNTVSEVNRTVKEAEETKKEAEAVVNSFQRLQPDVVAVKPSASSNAAVSKQTVSSKAAVSSSTASSDDVTSRLSALLNDGSAESFTASDNELISDVPDSIDISFMQEEVQKCNSNEMILELYRQGKSNVAIARELGLGVGEVKLVIDLYKNK